MGILSLVFKISTKAKMAKQIINTAQTVLPQDVKDDIAQKSGVALEKLQNVSAELLAKHAPDFSKKVARRAEPEALDQGEMLKAMNNQLQQLTHAMSDAKKPAAKKARKPAKA